MIIYPAIDLRGGRCVRLRQGDFAEETVFAEDPALVAQRWAAEGAGWLHVVNLDGAVGEKATANLAALQRILDAVQLPVQFGGGLRRLEDVARVLEMGVSRVILGTVALREPAIVEQAIARYGAQAVSVGIDARDGRVAVQGWLDVSDVQAVELARRVRAQGVERIVYTDISRDGMLTGVNVEATAQLALASGLRVIASGGVASLEDVRAIKQREADGIEGVIIGMALYRGAVPLEQALTIASGG
ncbi:MAG: 1-(5-phosphoribosyl)-5-[(5-phosphoribosylamino)methylideneamino]imidazole-4-carboxamide isomerase [Chloroflexi bacterium]|nr:1-(5-phosphoribosyl)-5-[(5-phosphoribosylamino)methylideneamino]imidazole-4-carboxamide isomerase [Chloroflexota bacterium]